MIDLHSHILPDLDDGPADTEGSLALARAASEPGVRTMVATPHVRDDHPFALEAIPQRTEALRSALSMAGGFGSPVRRFTVQLFSEGLVHDVASDSHGAHSRPPGLREGFERLDAELPGLAEQADWFAAEAPRAILADSDLPPRPPPLRAARGRIGRLLHGRAADRKKTVLAE